MFFLQILTLFVVAFNGCFSTSISMDSLEQRLCQSGYVFKFTVMSNVTSKCFKPMKTGVQANVTSSNAITSPSPNATTANHTTGKPKPGLNINRCILLYSHNVSISKRHIYKGNTSLALMDIVRLIDGKDYYEAIIRADLHFKDLLKLNKDYLFLGRQTPNRSIKENVFLSNMYTVENWSDSLANTLNNFNFTQNCN